MPWNAISDDFYDHPKVEEMRDDLADAAVALWTRALSYCGKHLTDGRVPAGKLRALSRHVSPHEVAGELVRVDLWSLEDDGSFRFHDYHEHAPKRADVLRKRKKEKARKEAWRQKKLAESVPSPVPLGQERQQNVSATALRRSPLPSPPLHDLIPSGSCPDWEVGTGLPVGSTKKPEPEPEPEEPSIASEIREVFGHWLTGWRRVVGGKNKPKLDDKRRGKIRARLREGYTVEQIKHAIDGMWVTPWNVEKKFWDVELVCRDGPHLERFMATGSGLIGLATKHQTNPADLLADLERRSNA